MIVLYSLALHSIAFIVWLLPTISYAAGDYISLIGIPITDPGTNPATGQYYVDLGLRMAIVAAGLLAVIKIIYAGLQYALVEMVTTKEQAKKTLYNSVLGLLIILAAVTILSTINTQLTNLEALPSITYSLDKIPTNVQSLFNTNNLGIGSQLTYRMDDTDGIELFEKNCSSSKGVVSLQVTGMGDEAKKIATCKTPLETVLYTNNVIGANSLEAGCKSHGAEFDLILTNSSGAGSGYTCTKKNPDSDGKQATFSTDTRYEAVISQNVDITAYRSIFANPTDTIIYALNTREFRSKNGDIRKAESLCKDNGGTVKAPKIEGVDYTVCLVE